MNKFEIASLIVAVAALFATIFAPIITKTDQTFAEEAAKKSIEQSLVQIQSIKSQQTPHFAVSTYTIKSKTGDRNFVLLTSDGGKVFDLTSEVVLDAETLYHDLRETSRPGSMARGHLFVRGYFTQKIDVLKNTVEIGTSNRDPKLLFKVRADVREISGFTSPYPKITLTPNCYIKVDCLDINRNHFTQVFSFRAPFDSSMPVYNVQGDVDTKEYLKLRDTFDMVNIDELGANRLLDDLKSGKGKPL